MTPFIILYVADVRTSAQFYADRLGVPVAEESPGFAMLPLPGGAMLGLWLRGGVAPAPTGGRGRRSWPSRWRMRRRCGRCMTPGWGRGCRS